MATKPTYTILSEIDYDSLDFNPDEFDELPDAMYQDPIIARIRSIMVGHVERLHPPETVFHSSNTSLYYNPENLNNRVLPDLYLAFDVDALSIRLRKLYLPWEVGKPPDFALEVGSVSTYRNDLGAKRDRYARIGILEYWRFDPTGGEYYGQPLAGERLEGETYQPIELTTEPDGVLKGYSPILQRSLCWRDGLLELYDAPTSYYHRDLTQAEAALEAEYIARQDAQTALNAERIARQDAEARIRALEEELRRRQSQ